MNAKPPPGLRWTGGPLGQRIASVLAVVSLLLSIYVGYRYYALVDCLKDADAADRSRTSALAKPTDVERAAETALLLPGGNLEDELAAVIASREATDRARAANPPPPATACG